MTKSNQINLEGRHAVVTGAAQGFGLAITTRMIESGASVSMWDIDGDELTKAAEPFGDRVYTHVVDVTDVDAIDVAVAESNDALGAIHILVNNAGITGPNDVTWNYPVDQWRRVIELDMNAVFYCCRAVIPQMIGQNYGRVVNIASIAGKEGNANAAAYSTAKAGVIGLTKSLGKELADYDIAINCITPAAAKTRIFEQMSQSHIDAMLSKIPRKRFVLVEEVAAMVCWMASEENHFTTGGVFDISGGRATY